MVTERSKTNNTGKFSILNFKKIQFLKKMKKIILGVYLCKEIENEQIVRLKIGFQQILILVLIKI